MAIALAFALVSCSDGDGRGETGETGMSSDIQKPGVAATLRSSPVDGTPAITPAEGSESELCGDLDALALAVMVLRALDASSTIDDIRVATEGVVSAWEDVKQSAEPAPVDLAPMSNALDQLATTAGSFRDDEGIGAAYVALLPAIGRLELSIESLSRESGCPP